MIDMVFEWDPEKEQENYKLHGIRFETAERVFFDPFLNGGYIMATVMHTAGKELPPEKLEAMKAEIEAAARRPYMYDPDSPLLTEEQLHDFHPVNYQTMEDRAQAMRHRPEKAAG